MGHNPDRHRLEFAVDPGDYAKLERGAEAEHTSVHQYAKALLLKVLNQTRASRKVPSE